MVSLPQDGQPGVGHLGQWELTDSIPPYSFNFIFPKGKGFYEFYSIATDQNGNREMPPPTADAWIQKK